MGEVSKVQHSGLRVEESGFVPGAGVKKKKNKVQKSQP